MRSNSNPNSGDQNEYFILPQEVWVTILMYLDFDEINPTFFVSKHFYHLAHISLQTEFFKKKIETEYPAYFKMAQSLSSKLSWKMMYESLCWERDQSQLDWIKEAIHKVNYKEGFVGLEFKAQLTEAIQSENWVEVKKLFIDLGCEEEWVQEGLLNYARLMQRTDLLPVFYEIFKAGFHSNDFGKLIEYHRPLDEIKKNPVFLSNVNKLTFFKSFFSEALISGYLDWIKFLIEEKNDTRYFEKEQFIKDLFPALYHLNQGAFQYLIDQECMQKIIQFHSRQLLEIQSFNNTLQIIYLIQAGCQLEWSYRYSNTNSSFHEYHQQNKRYTTNAMTEAVIAKNRDLIWYLNKFKPNAHHANLALRAASLIDGGYDVFNYLLKIAKPSIFFKPSKGRSTYQLLWIRDLTKTDKGLEISFVLHSTLKLASNHSDYGKMMKVIFTEELNAKLHQDFILQVLHSERSGERNMTGVLFGDCHLPISLIFNLYKKEGESTTLIEQANQSDLIYFSNFAKSQGTCLLKEIIPYYNRLKKADDIIDQILENMNEKQFLNQAFCEALSTFRYDVAEYFLEKGAAVDFVDPVKQKTSLELLCERTDIIDDFLFSSLLIKVFNKIAYPHIPQGDDLVSTANYILDQFDGAKPTWALLSLQNPELFDFMKKNYHVKLGSIMNAIKKQVEEMSSTLTNQSGTLFSAANDQKQLALKQAWQRCEEHIQWVLSPEFESAIHQQPIKQMKS